ncbi:amino acid adenylation domain-containing protein, partial [Nocardia sp. NPDC004750]
PLSFAQQRMWFLNKYDTSSAAYNLPIAIRLTGRLDAAALRLAVADVVRRHESLRTRYPAVNGVGHQLVLPESTAPDIAVLSVPADEVSGWIEDFASRGFDVSVEVPLRLAVLRVSADVHVLVVVVHHIAADGASMAPLVRDLMVAYDAERRGVVPTWLPLSVQYADYSQWQREILGDEEDPASLAAAQIAFWRSKLAGLPERIDLPFDRPRRTTPSGGGKLYSFTIPAPTHDALLAVARERGASLFMTVHAAFAVLLARLSGSWDLAIGSPVAGRGEAELDDLVGMFVNTLVLRTDIEPQWSFEELLDHVRESDLAAFSHTELPFERLVEILDPVRAPSHHPLFQVALFFQNMRQVGLELPDITIEEVKFDSQVANFELQLTVVPTEEGEAMSAMFTYATDLFDESTIAGFARRFVRLLTVVAENTRVVVGDVEFLTSTERDVLLHQRNRTAYELASKSLLAGYRRAVSTDPDRTAVIYEGQHLSYAEFDARVNRLARLLIARGVGPESLVGIAMRRSLDLVVGIYAVLTAGGGYVPVDPDHPAERVAYVLDVARPVCLLTTARDEFAFSHEYACIEIDAINISDYSADRVTDAERLATVHGSATAYVIFTSGSTGRPKGVTVSRTAINNQLAWMQAEYPLGPGDVYLQKTAVTFDVSLWGYLMPLQAGATLVVATPDGHRDPKYIADTIASKQVTVTDFVPSMLAAFAAHAPSDQLISLRDVFTIGEALPPDTVASFAAVSAAKLHNLYGPTEAAVSITYWQTSGTELTSIPIGRPQWNSTVYVLDSRLNPVPDGVVGELYLAGAQLARGYLRRPDLTSDRFVANPFASSGARMYRTGDLVRWTSTGALEYLGRADFQVKFRGQRIELGEIETVLLAQPSVNQAAVVVSAVPGGEQLTGYVVPAPGWELNSATLRAAVAELLPSYMVPAKILILDAFPLNSSGKLDRRGLPSPRFETREYSAPIGLLEGSVASVFADVLEIEQVGRDDDFFALGGNSLSATRVAARVSALLDVHLPIRQVFANPTVAALAAWVDSQSVDRGRPQLVARPRPDEVPLSMAQQRMWLLNRFDTSSAAYNVVGAVRLTGSLDLQALRKAIADVVSRHEVLRTYYPHTSSGPVQALIPIEQVSLDVEPQLTPESDLLDRLRSTASQGFDVVAEVPVRIALFAVGSNEDADPSARDCVLLFVVHHIAADGWSMTPLTRDVMTAYVARTQGMEPGWESLPVQYADFVIWQREVLGSEEDHDSLISKQLDYWRGTLAGLPDELQLSPRRRPAVASYEAGIYRFAVSSEVVRALNRIAHASGATLFMAVHTAFAVLLARLSGTRDIAVGVPIAGRGERVLDDMVGMFVNTLVLRSQVDVGKSFVDLLADVTQRDLEAFAHADVPFERLVEALNPVRSQARHPVFQVMLSYQNLGQATLELPGLAVSEVPIDQQTGRFDLQLTVSDGNSGGLNVELTFATDLFDTEYATTFAHRLTQVLEAVTAEPEAVVGDIELLDAAERELVVSEWNATAHPT